MLILQAIPPSKEQGLNDDDDPDENEEKYQYWLFISLEKHKSTILSHQLHKTTFKFSTKI